MAFSTAGGGASGPQMNVTPLIDVLLVLIIFFLVIVIGEQPKGFNAEIPQQPKTDKSIPAPERTIVIQVLDGKNPDHPDVRINDEVIAWNDLHKRLVDIFAIRVERIAFIKADNDIDFERVADVIDTANHAGVQRLGLLHDESAAAHPIH
jgi:biopolymer transport protein TolR